MAASCPPGSQHAELLQKCSGLVPAAQKVWPFTLHTLTHVESEEDAGEEKEDLPLPLLPTTSQFEPDRNPECNGETYWGAVGSSSDVVKGPGTHGSDMSCDITS